LTAAKLSPPATRREALRTLIRDHYNGDATSALLDLAHAGHIAVNYLDRTWFASYLDEYHGITLTEQAWADIAPYLYQYDEHVCGYVEPNVQNDFALRVAHNVGLLEEDTEVDQ
jgi:hypothetical protein